MKMINQVELVLVIKVKLGLKLILGNDEGDKTRIRKMKTI